MALQPSHPTKKLPPLSILAAVGGSKKESTPSTQSKSNGSAPTIDGNAGIPPAAAKPPPLHQDNNNNTNLPASSGGYESMNSNSSGSGGSTPKKRVRPPCSVPTCTNRVVQGGKCITHGAKRPLCKHPGCEKAVKSKGFCSGHGPKRKACDVQDCAKVAVQGGKCIKHGAKRSNDKHTLNDGDYTKLAIEGEFHKRHDEAVLLKDANLLSNLYYSSAASDSSGGEGEMKDAPMNDAPQSESNSQKSNNNNNDSSLLDDCKMGGVDDISPSTVKERMAKVINFEETKPKPMQVDEPSKPKPNPANDEAISGASAAYGYWGGSVVAVPRLPPKSYNPDPHPLQSYKPSPPVDEHGEDSDASHQLANNSDDDEVEKTDRTEPGVNNSQGGFDDSNVAAASRSSSPTEDLKEDAGIAKKNVATKEVAKSPAKTSNLMSNLAPEECPISPQFKAMKGTTPPRSYYTFVPNANDPKTPPKKQIKFNVGGTIVQVPSGILLKYEHSKLASMARSALRMDVSVPIPRQFDMFSHCVFYLCNDKVHLPPSIRRKAFMKEMEYFGIPYDEKCISGGCSSSLKKSSLNHKPNIVTGHKDASNGGLAKPSSPSSLDLEPITARRSSRAGKDSPAAIVPQQPGSDSKKSRPCGECEGCLRDDCGECSNCKDKKKYGGPNKMRQKCSKRYCANMIRPGEEPSPKSAASASRSDDAAKKKKDTQPNLSVLAAEKRWAENLMLLRPCIEEGGCINYANISNPEIRNRVKNYVKEQRRQFRRMENGESTSLTKERLAQLEEANFPKSHKKTPFKMTKPEPAAPSSAISAALAELGLKKRPTLSTLKPNSSSLDLLCSITSQTFDNEIDGGSWSSGACEEEQLATDLTPPKKGLKTKGSCGACPKCLREDCGKCRACLDKPKYGGPNTMRQRCYERRCMNKVDRHPPPVVKVRTPGGDSNGARSEEARMKAELAKIKAELEAKARGHNYGMKLKNQSNLMTRSSRRSYEELSRQYEGSEEDVDSDDEIMDTSDEDSTIMDSDADSDADSDDEIIDDERFATSRDSVSAPPRGVSVRPSGKWQVQLSYAGSSRYIGLFDSKDEATTAYKLAKQCRTELDDDDPPTHRVKGNLDLMRKAAFSQYSSSDADSSSSMEEEEEEEEEEEYRSRRRVIRQERKQNEKTAPRRGPGRPLGSYKKGKPRPVKSSRGRGRPLGSANKKGKKASERKPPPETIKPPPETTNRYAKSYARSRRAEAPKPPPPAPVPKSARIQKKRAAAPKKVEDYNLPKLDINPEILEAAKATAGSLPRGITVRPSGKWQVQLYYLGKSRYIGVFDSKTDAAIGYELARSCVETFKDENPGVDQLKKNIALMRKAAYSDVTELLKQSHGNKKRKTEAKPATAALTRVVEEEKKEAPKALPKTKSDRSARASKRNIDEIADTKSSEPAAKTRATIEAKNERARAVAKNVETKKSVAPPTPDPALSSLPANAEKVVGVVEHLMNCKVPLDELREKGRNECKDMCRPAGILYGNQFWQDIRSLLSDAIDAAEKGESVDRDSLFRIYAPSSVSNVKPAAKASSVTKPKPEAIQTQVQPTATASNELTFETGEAAAAHQLSQFPRQGRTEDLVEVGPGWKVNIVPRVGGDRSDFYYFSPTGERFRSLKQAKAAHAKGSVQLGSVGYKFRKNFSDDSGNELGWFDGEVVEILAGSDKRKCLYAADGYIEELSLAELKELKALESKTPNKVDSKLSSFGSVGHKFSKQFPDGRWFDGVVVEILKNVGKKDRRCHYPEDDDFEDLSLADLRRLAELEKNKMEAVVFTHNDLCECCGEAGELLCCATCNLVYHFACYPNMTVEPPDDWSCAFCVADSKKASKQAIQQARATVKEIEAMKEEARKKKTTYKSGSSKKKCNDPDCTFKMHKGGFCRKHGEQHAETCRVKECQNIWCRNLRK